MPTGITITPAVKILSIFNSDDFSETAGETVQFLTGVLQIPANSVNTNNTSCVVELTARAIKTGVNNTAILRIYINTTSSLTGATLLATGGAPGATDLYQQLDRTLFVAKGPVYTKVAPPTSPLFSDNGRSTTAESSIVIDWKADQYIMLSVQNASTLDESIGTGIIFKIYK
jgi:hypothetical protein